jgi:hypothetical protein
MRYRKVDPRIWKDEKFLTLNQTEKLIAVYCLTSPQTNRIGIFNFSPAQAAEDLNLDLETFAEGFAKVCERLNWTFDKAYRVLYLPTWWKYNCPDNPNVLIGNLKDLHEIPKTPLIQDFLANVQYLPETLHETFLKGLPKPSRNQEQEQEQENNGRNSFKVGKKSPKTYSEDILNLASLLADEILSNNPKHRALNRKREETVLKWAEDIDKLHRIDHQTLEDIRTVIVWAQKDDFWKTTILSAKSLRKNWDRLLPQAQKPNKKKEANLADQYPSL